MNTARTKIVCTIGPASSATATLEQMIQAGMDVARINFSHGNHDSNIDIIRRIRKAADNAGKKVAILQDLQGPKIRVGQLPEAGIELIEGKMATLQAGVLEADQGIIPVPYERLAHDVRPGDRILIADGTRELEVLKVSGTKIQTNVLLGGTVISHKGINVPTVSLSVESLTEKDEEDLAFGVKQNIDFVALSFVRSADDVIHLQEKIKKYLPDNVEPPQIIAKIEKHEAIARFDEILEVVDGIMVARGDLGLETPVAKVPIHQKELIAKCVVAGKPVITATEMLASMEKNPRPTRAEVSDVANAVIDHTDAVMLSGESAMGTYPVQSVATMNDIIIQTEESPLDNLLPHPGTTGESLPRAMAAAAVELSRRIGAVAMLVTTRTGYSARSIARFRPELPVYTTTDSQRTCNQLLLSWGVIPFHVKEYTAPEKMVKKSLEIMRDVYNVKKGMVVVVSGLKQKEGEYDNAIRVVEL